MLCFCFSDLTGKVTRRKRRDYSECEKAFLNYAFEICGGLIFNILPLICFFFQKLYLKCFIN